MFGSGFECSSDSDVPTREPATWPHAHGGDGAGSEFHEIFADDQLDAMPSR
jgi:hypothetical protein